MLKLTLTPEQAAGEIEELLRTMPSVEQIVKGEDFTDWGGRAQAVMRAVEAGPVLFFPGELKNMLSGRITATDAAWKHVRLAFQNALHSFRLQSGGASTKAIGKGSVFDYFDEVRGIIERGRQDLLFVDPYLNADFVSRYLPHVAAGTKVRLLGRHAITQLVPAVEMMRQQQGLDIEVRYAEGFHDRWLFLDGIEGYHSSASFHDGAKKAPTLLTPVLDVFAAVKSIYESAWAAGVVK